MRIGALPIGFCIGAFVLSISNAIADETFSPEQLDFFEQKIRPVLVKHCYECHSIEADKSKGDLLLDSRVVLLRGGEEGPAIVPFKPDQSLLIKAIRYVDEDMAMPPEKKGGKLPDAVISDFEQWVKMGAPDPRKEQAKTIKSYDSEKAKSWWSYQPLKKVTVPATKGDQWSVSSIDRFVYQEMQEHGVKPVEDAEKATLLRRVFLDLVGFQPSVEYLNRYLTSSDPKELEKMIDLMLSSRYFGERWGRHWLDVARYAETTGRDVNVTMPESWRYRDYVINSFNTDKPFDQFIREQIAGDLIPATDPKDRTENLIATGFLAVGPKGINEMKPRQFALDQADEQIDTVTRAFLGTTVSCARCHDHKFDPITQKDYTAIAGIFLSTDTHYGTAGGVAGRNASKLIDAPASSGLTTIAKSISPQALENKKAELKKLQAEQAEAFAARRRGKEGTMNNGFEMVRIITQVKQLEIEIASYNPDGTPKARIMGVLDKPVKSETASRMGNGGFGGSNFARRFSSGFETIVDSPLFARGDIDKEEGKVPRGLPEFLSAGKKASIPTGTSGRLELAEWIASTENTLAARVIVNRVWSLLFGRGLVESVDNFGASGTTPSHPELLDHLAQQFIADGWSVKKLIKRIMLSRVYQLDSSHNEANHKIDPDNKWLWRYNAQRLDAEAIRDCMLTASGLMDLTPQTGSLIASAGDGLVGGLRVMAIREDEISSFNSNFRSVYLPIARNVEPEILSVFDFAEPSMVSGVRDTTIVPPQALFMMNSKFVEEQAKALAQRVMTQLGFEKRFSLACRLVWSREPTKAEAAAAKAIDRNDLASWTSICRALYASADFQFIN